MPERIALLVDERTARPYFIYRIFESMKAENVAVCDHFHEALAIERELRESAGPSHQPEVKMIETDTGPMPGNCCSTSDPPRKG